MRDKRLLITLLLLLAIGAAGLLFQVPTMMAANLVSLDLWRRTAANEPLLTTSQAARLATSLQEGSATRLRTLARFQAAHGNSAESEASYRAALAQRPGDTLALFELANLLAAQGREEEAIPLWRQAGAGPYWSARGAELAGCGDDPGGGLYYLQRAAQIDPADGLSQYRLGKRLAECEQWAEAVKAFSVPIESNYPDPLILYDAYIERGLAGYQAGLGLEAVRADIEQAMQLQPRNPWPWLRLCTIYRQEGLYTEAIAAGNRGVALAPELAFAYYYRGQAWRASGDLERAIADLEHALTLEPNLDSARRVLDRITEGR